MSSEIKEILDDFKWYIEQKNEQDINGEYEYPRELTQEEAKILLDYISNLQQENEDLREENKEAHDFDETMKDIKDNLIARINRQEKEIAELKAKLEMYENGVYFSSENDELQQRIDRLNHSLEQANKEIKNLEKHRDIMIKHYDDEVKEYYDIIKEAIDYVEHISNVDIDWHEQDRIVNILRRIDNERI